MRFSVRCFGTGDGASCAERNHAAFLYRLGKTRLLIDCGEPIDGSCNAVGLSPDAIDSIFISHLHSDHAGGFFMLMQGFWLAGRKKDLPVFLPMDAIKPMRQMLNAFFLFDEVLSFRLRLFPLKNKKPVTVNGVRVTPFRTTHLNASRAQFQRKYGGDFAAYCFLIESSGRRVGHSSDLGRPEDLEPLLEKPLDLLVCEIAHFSPEQIFGYLKGRDIKRVVFVHLARPYWENLARTRRLAAKMLPELPHTFARDFEEISF